MDKAPFVGRKEELQSLDDLTHKKTSSLVVIKGCFQEKGILFREFKDIFIDIFSKRSDLYQTIVRTLVDGDKEFEEISTATGAKNNGHMSDHLNNLIQSGLVCRNFAWVSKHYGIAI